MDADCARSVDPPLGYNGKIDFTYGVTSDHGCCWPSPTALVAVSGWRQWGPPLTIELRGRLLKDNCAIAVYGRHSIVSRGPHSGSSTVRVARPCMIGN
jgi:hypothetical protein